MEKKTRQQRLGQAGESFAANYLAQQGWQFRARNYHAPGGEIDLIMYDPYRAVWVMVEVKTRTYTTGLGSINAQKIRRIRLATEHFFFKHKSQQYVPDYEMWGLILRYTRGRRFQVLCLQPL